MRRSKWVAVAGAGLLGGILTLAACAPDVSTGTVTGKHYNAGYMYEQPVMIGKSMSLIPEWRPECWEIDLKNAKGHKGSVCVSSETYNATKVGAQYGQ